MEKQLTELEGQESIRIRKEILETIVIQRDETVDSKEYLALEYIRKELYKKLLSLIS